MKNELDSKQRRQGDVLLVEVGELPPDATKEDTGGESVVIAHGEVTGHKHQFLFRDAEMYRSGGAQVVKVLREAGLLKHEEHTEIAFPPGVYKRVVQVEYHPAALRTVAD